MPTLRELRIEPGQVVSATGRIRSGGLVPLGPRPTGDGQDHVELASRLRLADDIGQEDERVVMVTGEWHGVSLRSPAIRAVSAPPWFPAPPIETRDGQAHQPWGVDDIHRALEIVPDGGLLVTGEGHDQRGRRVAWAVFTAATPAAIPWKESFPVGMIECLTWLRPGDVS